MNQMASQQGQLSQQAGGMLPMPGGAGAMQEQIRALGAQQRAAGRTVGADAGRRQSPGHRRDGGRRERPGSPPRGRPTRPADGGAAGTPVPPHARRRTHSAGTGRGRGKERQSTTAGDDSVHLPPALRSLLQGNDAALRLPSWEAMQNLSPSERRMVVEYFRRLSEQGGR